MSVSSVLAGALGLSLCLAACGGPPTNSKQAMQKTLALELTNVLDGYGIPIPADQVGCAGPGKSGKMLCFGESNDSPPDSIQATYTPKRPVFDPGRCPGQLVVTGNATTLTKVAVNPCA